MNIAFFLTPKSEIAFVPINSTLRQALEKMEYHRYTAVPIIDSDGRYVGTLTEGDLLWHMKKLDVFSVKDLEEIPLTDVPRRFQHQAVSVRERVEALLKLALDQSFVPVVDDEGRFIGIVTRKAVISFFADKYLKGLIEDEGENSAS